MVFAGFSQEALLYRPQTQPSATRSSDRRRDVACHREHYIRAVFFSGFPDMFTYFAEPPRSLCLVL